MTIRRRRGGRQVIVYAGSHRGVDAAGSACSIMFGTGVVKTAPGCMEDLHLVVSDINAARSQLAERGVEVSEVET